MPDENSIELFDKNREKLLSLEIDGVETIIGDYCPKNIYGSLPIQGIHIIYFPTWLDIWYGNIRNLEEDFMTAAPYGISTPDELVDIFVEQFLSAMALNPQYLVFHISHVRPRDIFTMRFSYSDKEVLAASSELLNQVFKNEKLKKIIEKKDMEKSESSLPYLLFENLPWPGLRFADPSLEIDFLGSVHYPKKGFMLDLSHFICLETNISDYSQGAEHIISSLKKLEGVRENIIGIHLNGSLSKSYLSKDFSALLSTWEKGNSLERYEIEISHIKSIDTHSVFESHRIKDIISLVDPKFLVYELGYKTFEELLSKVEIQNSFLNNL